MDSRDQFLKIIRDEYLRLTNNLVSIDKVDLVSNAVTDFYYEQYQRFGAHPKRIKRYSTFQLRDLDHPQALELVIKVIKERVGLGYEHFVLPFLNMNMVELKQFEKRREDFYKMF